MNMEFIVATRNTGSLAPDSARHNHSLTSLSGNKGEGEAEG